MRRRARRSFFSFARYTVPEDGPQASIYAVQKQAAEQRMAEFDSLPEDFRALVNAIGLIRQADIRLIYELQRRGVKNHAVAERIKAEIAWQDQEQTF